MRVVITGASGFIGSHLVRAMQPQYQGEFELELVCGDTPPATYEKCLSKRVFRRSMQSMGRIDSIVHLGACADTRCQDWGYLADNNLAYTKEIIDYCHDSNTSLIIASSAATYGKVGKAQLCSDMELEPLFPVSMYGWSKHLADCYASAVGSKCTSLKFFNVYGSGEGHKGEMASFPYKAVQAARAGLPIKVFDGDFQRDFVWVGDVVDVIKFFVRHPSPGIFNVGSGRTIKFADIASRIADEHKTKVEAVPFPKDLASQYQPYTLADISKLRVAGYQKPFMDITSTDLEKVF